MDKLPAGIRNKLLLKKQAVAAGLTSGPSSESSTPLVSGAESQIATPPTTATPAIPYPLANLEECMACANPCIGEIPTFPNYIVKSIDHTLPLAGTVKPYSRHILIATGKKDWIHS